MTTDLRPGAAADFAGSLTWKTAGGAGAEATIPQVEIVATTSADEAAHARNETVFARVTSVEASERQLEAAQAYANGDGAHAMDLIQQNIAALRSAGKAAPAPVAAALTAQSSSYDSTMSAFRSAPPMSVKGRVAVKSAAAHNLANASVSAF